VVEVGGVEVWLVGGGWGLLLLGRGGGEGEGEEGEEGCEEEGVHC